MRHAFLTIIAAAAVAAPLHARAASGGDEDRRTLIEALECHAYTEARLRDTARKLAQERRWTYAHEALEADTLLHEAVTARIEASVDRRLRRALMVAYFPDGVTSGDSETRVDRWTRCRRLYNQVKNELGEPLN
jgi:hypothetical protein